MSKTRTRNTDSRLLPFSVIKAASGGDVSAINKVLKHYEGYIISLSKRRLYDEYGNMRLFVDNELRRTLEIRLIVKILRFNAV